MYSWSWYSSTASSTKWAQNHDCFMELLNILRSVLGVQILGTELNLRIFLSYKVVVLWFEVRQWVHLIVEV